MSPVNKCDLLLEKGVCIPQPAAVDIAAEIDVSRIASGVMLHPGTRLRGEGTSIGPGCEIGGEAPVTIENCQLNRNVRLAGGFFSGATFMDGANLGSGAHIRPGTLFEEEANGAHTVGLKQTILLPFVTLGSLINFCDILMAGGTSRKNHSEVGSSYIHFNFTPHQDKATPSLVGDVPQGVFLDQSPIFLGGQGGLAGPTRIAYGTVIAAGYVARKDVLDAGMLHIPQMPKSTTISYPTGIYRRIGRVVKNNLIYIGNILALKAWYEQVRKPLMVRDLFDQACYEGAVYNLELVLRERIKRMRDLSEKMEFSITLLEMENAAKDMITEQKTLARQWPKVEKAIVEQAAKPPSAPDSLLQALRIPSSATYIETIQSLPAAIRTEGSAWLQRIVDQVTAYIR